MRAISILSCVAVVIIVATVSKSRGDGEGTDGSGSAADAEPITEQAVPNGSGEPDRDPFVPTETPGLWKYEDLTAVEKDVADKGLNEDPTAIQDAYAAASRDLAARARAEAAAMQLGIENSESGVVP